MSARSIAAFADFSRIRRRVQTLTEGLRAVASGEAFEQAMVEVEELVRSVAKSQLARHVDTGRASSDLVVARDGGLIQLSDVGYARFYALRVLRSGMPPFVLKRAAIILAGKVKAALGGTYGGLGEVAGDVLAEASDAAKKKVASAGERKIKAKARRAAASAAKKKGGT